MIFSCLPHESKLERCDMNMGRLIEIDHEDDILRHIYTIRADGADSFEICRRLFVQKESSVCWQVSSSKSLRY